MELQTVEEYIDIWPIVILGIWIGSIVPAFLNACKTRHWMFFAKRIVNRIRFPVTTVWVFYFLILVTQTIAPVNRWALDWAATHPEQRDIAMIAPLVYVLTIIWVACKAFLNIDKPIINYNERELAWRKEAQEKGKAQLRKLMFWKKESVR